MSICNNFATIFLIYNVNLFAFVFWEVACQGR